MRIRNRQNESSSMRGKQRAVVWTQGESNARQGADFLSFVTYKGKDRWRVEKWIGGLEEFGETEGQAVYSVGEEGVQTDKIAVIAKQETRGWDVNRSRNSISARGD